MFTKTLEKMHCVENVACGFYDRNQKCRTCLLLCTIISRLADMYSVCSAKLNILINEQFYSLACKSKSLSR